MEKQIKRNERELKRLLDKYGSKNDELMEDELADSYRNRQYKDFYCRPNSDYHFTD